MNNVAKSEELMSLLQQAIMDMGLEWHEDIAKEIVDKYAKNWRGRRSRQQFIACMVAEYLMRTGNNDYFVRELAEMFGINVNVLLAMLRNVGVKYVPDYDKRATKELGDNAKHWYDIKDKVRASPVVLMASIEYILTDKFQREVASKYGVSDMAIRSCVKRIKNISSELRERLKFKKYVRKEEVLEMKVKVVWISRHELNEENEEILNRAFGNWELVKWVKDTVTAEDLRKLAEEYSDATFVVVLPPHLLAELLKYTKRVYRFVVDREVKEDGTAIFTPTGLERVVRIEIVTERLV